MGGRTLTVGVLTPHVTAGPEIEIPVMSAGHVATVVSRIPLPARSDAGATSPQSLREGARPSALDGAAKAFPHGSVDALAYASTSSGYVTGVPDDGPVSWTAREDAAAAAAAILASNGRIRGPDDQHGRRGTHVRRHRRHRLRGRRPLGHLHDHGRGRVGRRPRQPRHAGGHGALHPRHLPGGPGRLLRRCRPAPRQPPRAPTAHRPRPARPTSRRVSSPTTRCEPRRPRSPRPERLLGSRASGGCSGPRANPDPVRTPW